MAKVAFDPFDYAGKIQIEVEKIDSDKLENFENPIEIKKKIYGEKTGTSLPNNPNEITMIDTRDINWESIELKLTAEVKNSSRLEYAIIRFDCHWTQWNKSILVSKKTENNKATFSTNFNLLKRNVSSQVMVKVFFFDATENLLDMSQEFFIQSDGRDGPDITKGLFNIQAEDFTKIKDDRKWFSRVKKLDAINQSFALDIPDDEKITIFYNKAFGGFETLDSDGLSSLEKSINNFQKLFIGLAPFLIESIRSSYHLQKLEERYEENINTTDGEDKKVRDNNYEIKDLYKSDLLKFIKRELKNEDEFKRNKIEMLSQVLYKDDEDLNICLLNYLQDSHIERFDELSSRAVLAYQSQYYVPNPSKSIGNYLGKIRETLRKQNQQDKQDDQESKPQ